MNASPLQRPVLALISLAIVVGAFKLFGWYGYAGIFIVLLVMNLRDDML